MLRASPSLAAASSGPGASSAARSAIAGRPGTWVFGLEAQGDWADLNNQRVSLINPSVLHAHHDRRLSASSLARSATPGIKLCCM